MRWFLLGIAATFLAGCASTSVPIGRLDYSNPHAKGEKKLLIFLRGAGGGHHIFKSKGLVDVVIDRKLPFDMVSPDAHAGYYKEESLGRRLYEDIILPAKQDGYKEIWVAGTSMGGLGALMLLTDYAKYVDGVILLSPFLGWGGIRREIIKAGGLQAWQPGPHTIEDWQRYLWTWLKGYSNGTREGPPIYLGYGKDDFFRKSMELLSANLPKPHVTTIDGGHTYSTLKRLWPRILDRIEPILRR